MTHPPADYDVVIIGAGISGINTAYHLQTEVPNNRYAILEGRGNIGGTWDLFRYPGIRSDTDLHTFGLPWNPWMEDRAIADGGSIVRHLQESAAKHAIDSNIRFHHRVVAAEWSSDDQLWSLRVEVSTPEDDSNALTTISILTRFLVLGTGYYDYREPLSAHIPGLKERFQGTTIHPQFWPQDLDYTNKRIVIIGSGATAITLLPNLAAKAKHVTMLQRSPTYIMSINNSTANSWLHKILPASMVFQVLRIFFLCVPVIIYYFCRLFPSTARRINHNHVAKQLPAHIKPDPHFNPLYKPWDERLCFTPDGDFFESMRKGNATVETGHIKAVTPDGILLQSGQFIPADIIVTATGLKLEVGGGMQLRVDGQTATLAGRYAWNSALVHDIPNFAFVMGYTNAPWTLGAETTAVLVCRILRRMRKNGLTSVVPRLDNPESLRPTPMWNLKATYVKEAGKWMPKCGHEGPWKPRSIYFVDILKARYGNFTDGLQFYRGSKAV
ncbi:hypothetical protein FE257_004448 [Aspergillus nanangensis]|uniref:FAD/NAD(P)-binding domain-containing protein n=1 Tax=Aspergillus nanangensis TaxID=2582783 RepID=A0AAD4CZZ2_ASPNN|nr:hypothetical protein FE257_004448 [Aspergillus nanangensis]